MSTNKTPTYEKNINKRALIYGLMICLMLGWSFLMIQLTQGEELFIFETAFFVITLLGSRWMIHNMNWGYYLAVAMVISILFFISILIAAGVFILFWKPLMSVTHHLHEETLMLLYFVGVYVILLEGSIFTFRKSHNF